MNFMGLTSLSNTTLQVAKLCVGGTDLFLGNELKGEKGSMERNVHFCRPNLRDHQEEKNSHVLHKNEPSHHKAFFLSTRLLGNVYL